MDIQDKQLQRLISLTLRTGVLVAVLVGVLGGTVFLHSHRSDPVSFQTFVGAKSLFASPSRTVQQAFHPQTMDTENRGLAIAQVGIICLLLTPIIRVALSIVGFALEHDRVYVVITAVVLATLTCSMLLH
ncbi:DUF1634 domain-containing protein [Edaphobacter modestus]|uniref:Putative membrane protein n=1 Tax=Edaphobacter modestus TaxID=388466 RepID=A0A4Q7YZI2_9BACT|nr:DUF1634 domain-containing protein [Edaphobacter modestus]RZU43337.1 putative membrane protein [Edaphobacter modestus]